MSGFWVAGALALGPLPAHAASFTDGEFVTYTQGTWGEDPNGANIATFLENEFFTLFAPESDLLEVGIPGPSGFSIIFDNPDDLIAYLPSSGAPAPLDADLLDPTSTASGALGGEVIGLTLNVLVSDEGFAAHPPGVPLGDLVLQNLSGGEAVFNTLTVRDMLPLANLALGGDVAPFAISDLFDVISNINESFNGGPVTPWAQEFLALPPSAASTVPEPSTWAMLTTGFVGLGLMGWRARLGRADRAAL